MGEKGEGSGGKGGGNWEWGTPLSTPSGMVPAINADEFLIPIRNKRNIKPRVQSDFQTTNIVEKFSTNHFECFKIPDSHTEQYRNSFFVRTVSEWNQLEESHPSRDS